MLNVSLGCSKYEFVNSSLYGEFGPRFLFWRHIEKTMGKLQISRLQKRGFGFVSNSGLTKTTRSGPFARIASLKVETLWHVFKNQLP